jgi:hypothetical protein
MDSPLRFTPASTALDAPDAQELARFCRGLLGWPVRKEEPGRVEIGPSDGTAGLSFQTEPLFLPPAMALHPDRYDPAGHPFCFFVRTGQGG